jgi:hypothetical protein
MDAHGGESPTRKANARRHVVHAAVLGDHIQQNKKAKKEPKSPRNSLPCDRNQTKNQA